LNSSSNVLIKRFISSNREHIELVTRDLHGSMLKCSSPCCPGTQAAPCRVRTLTFVEGDKRDSDTQWTASKQKRDPADPVRFVSWKDETKNNLFGCSAKSPDFSLACPVFFCSDDAKRGPIVRRPRDSGGRVRARSIKVSSSNTNIFPLEIKACTFLSLFQRYVTLRQCGRLDWPNARLADAPSERLAWCSHVCRPVPQSSRTTKRAVRWRALSADHSSLLLMLSAPRLQWQYVQRLSPTSSTHCTERRAQEETRLACAVTMQCSNASSNGERRQVATPASDGSSSVQVCTLLRQLRVSTNVHCRFRHARACQQHSS
jgi:hypothetical protein